MSPIEQPEGLSPDHPGRLSIDDYTYELPEERIAQQPLPERDAGRLLVLRDEVISDHRFRELPDLLPPDTLLVLNDTRVVAARIPFTRSTGAAMECMVLSPGQDRPIEQALLDRGSSRWWCMMGNARRWKGELLVVERQGHVLQAFRVEQRSGEHLIEFRWEGEGPFIEQLERFGSVPLPPYMRRPAVAEDDTRYNTVFAQRNGSVAAPTASLHFSEALLDGLAAKGIASVRLTLHVGAGTFLPVKTERMSGHAMHAEQVRIPLRALERVVDHLGKGLIIPVGTTAMRTLESVYWHGVMLLQGRAGKELSVDQWEPYGHTGAALPGPLDALQAVLEQVRRAAAMTTGPEDAALLGNTRLLIAPGYTFRLVDGVVTNFHQPRSTLLLLVAALIGPRWRAVYRHALEQDYRFLSYGDGSLLFRAR